MIDISTPPNQAHNLKVVGSNPTRATNVINTLAALVGGFFLFVRKTFASRCGACSQKKVGGHKGRGEYRPFSGPDVIAEILSTIL